MKFLSGRLVFVLCLLLSKVVTAQTASSGIEPFIKASKKPLQISGVYPHLAVFNEGGSTACEGKGANANEYEMRYEGREVGIGATVPWAGKLWMITYSPHCPRGSSDKLYSVDNNLDLTIHPESVGGTPANRMIHKESNQLITGSYFIDAAGKVRVVPLTRMPGRMTATARHLKDPANMVYFYDMEGMLYEVNVHTLAVNKLFHKPVPGWHGKGGYTAQNRLIIANNGEHKVFDIKKEHLQTGEAPRNDDEKGTLASWDGKNWKIIERKQFTDVTGPGGIYGAPDDKAPAWSIGWDKRSVILKLLDGGVWYTYRLPKSTHTYDGLGGWFTEWPRIREVGNNKLLMDMHGMFYDFPKTFSRANSGGISPINNHLRYVPDFCNWNGKLVLATDETSILQNPMAGRSQSNLWFGQWSDLKEWGGATGWGGPWMKDTVKSNTPSDPYLINGFGKKVLHLNHDASTPVTFTLEIDKTGNNNWSPYKTVTVSANSYEYFIFPADFTASWIRIKTNKDCKASAYFHYTGKMHEGTDQIFNAIAGIDEPGIVQSNLIRPAGHNKNLQVLNIDGEKKEYVEVNENLEFLKNVTDSSTEMERILGMTKDYEVDEASVIIKDNTGTFRLPKTSPQYDRFDARRVRELESERYMLNAHGTFYEVGRESGFAAIRPITTHKKKIVDFCTWRGLLVISGTKPNSKNDGHYFNNSRNTNGLWFGAIDDLWKLGKPTGEGGIWKNAEVKVDEPSLPFLMTGYDKKKISLTADKDVTITLEVDVDHQGWNEYKKIKIVAGKTIEHIFPDGYSAHWIRAIADKDCKATVWFTYR